MKSQKKTRIDSDTRIEGKKMITKKLYILASCVLITACGGGDSSEVVITDVNPNVGLPGISRIMFNPGAGVLPVPNDLLFAGTQDGTIEAPGEADARNAGGVDLGNPALALGALDGWSTIFPLQVSVDTAEGSTIDATTLSSANVFMIETITPPLDGSAGNCQLPGVSVGSPCGVVTPLTYGVDFVAVAGNNSISIAPLRPLKTATTYVVGIGSGITDSRGQEIQGSEFYQDVTRNDVTITTPPLDVLQAATNLYEAIVALGAGGNPAAAPDMIFSAAWTTASVGNVIGTATSLLAATPPSITNIANIGGSPVAVTVEDALIAQGALDASVNGLTGLDAAIFLQGEVSLPYYSGTAADGSDPILNGWRARCDNPLATAEARATGLQAVEPNNTICSTINPALGDFLGRIQNGI